MFLGDAVSLDDKWRVAKYGTKLPSETTTLFRELRDGILQFLLKWLVNTISGFHFPLSRKLLDTMLHALVRMGLAHRSSLPSARDVT